MQFVCGDGHKHACTIKIQESNLILSLLATYTIFTRVLIICYGIRTEMDQLMGELFGAVMYHTHIIPLDYLPEAHTQHKMYRPEKHIPPTM